jgi:hypothetical protein
MNARLDGHDSQFQALVSRAQTLLATGRFDDAAAACQVAGHYAWFNHTGRFGSSELEDVCHRLAEACLPQVESTRPRTARPQVVLHVATQVYQTGGPTQAIAFWVEQDLCRQHRVCLTRQGAPGIPPKLRSRVGADDLNVLDRKPGGLLSRAARLQAAASQADLVLLHTHPFDVVPVMALSKMFSGAPVVYVNHGDHTFWLGASVANVVLNMRDSGSALAVARRGIEAKRCVVVPRPLRPGERKVTKEEAKRLIGIAPDQILVVTAADGAKYRAVVPPSLLDMVLPVFEAHPNAAFIAAGPTPTGDWAQASQRTQGRVRAVGRLPDVSLLQQAADIYLDSFPFSSLTSLLEAGRYGAALITYRGHPDDCAVLGADTRGVDEHMLRPRTPVELADALTGLLTDRDRLAAWGERARAAVRDAHQLPAWNAALRQTYALAAALDPPRAPPVALRSTSTLDVLVDRVMEQTGYSLGVSGAMRDHLGLLGTWQRLAQWLALWRGPTRPLIRGLLPEWTLPHIAQAWRAVSKRRGAPDDAAATRHDRADILPADDDRTLTA